VKRLPALALLGVALYYAVIGGEYSAMDLLDLDARREREAEALAAARARVDSLQAVATALESDDATIEAVARERFGMVRDGEVLYRFLDVGIDTVAH
jgi:cell division protein FtsB